MRKPLDPQPSPYNILTLVRRYTQLKKAATYHRRVRGVYSTKVWSHKAFLTERALYEYVGEFPGFSTYGSLPEERDQYQRTHTLVHTLMKEQIADDYNPQITYRKLTKEEYAVGARNIAQVYRKKQLMNRREAGELGSKTFVIQLISSVSEGDEFIQSVILDSGKPLSIVLYTNTMMDLVRENCCRGLQKHVLGVDRTFNLADAYATLTTFKHFGLICHETKNNPLLFIGPMLVHGSCTNDVYSHLFLRFAISFMDTDISQLTIGT